MVKTNIVIKIEYIKPLNKKKYFVQPTISLINFTIKAIIIVE